jgi:hypothetical protein
MVSTRDLSHNWGRSQVTVEKRACCNSIELWTTLADRDVAAWERSWSVVWNGQKFFLSLFVNLNDDFHEANL